MNQYTETLNDYIEYIGGIDEFNTRWSAKFGVFPNFTLGDLNLDLKTLFLDKYSIREIGSETETMFEHYLRTTLDELAIKYVPKIQLFIANWNSIYDRKIELNESHRNSYYLNPVNVPTSSTSPKLTDFDDTKTSREVPINLLRITNAKMLDEIMKLKNIYLDLLEDFQPLFMSVL